MKAAAVGEFRRMVVVGVLATGLSLAGLGACSSDPASGLDQRPDAGGDGSTDGAITDSATIDSATTDGGKTDSATTDGATTDGAMTDSTRCVSQRGEHCGGNISNPCTCATGLTCTPADGGPPFGDVGGTCEPAADSGQIAVESGADAAGDGGAGATCMSTSNCQADLLCCYSCAPSVPGCLYRCMAPTMDHCPPLP
jgi:hypothetical protein